MRNVLRIPDRDPGCPAAVAGARARALRHVNRAVRPAAPVPRILVHVTGDRIGDALIKWPVIRALKHALPEHRLVWMAGLRRSVFAGPLAALAAGVIDEVRDNAQFGVRWSEWLHPTLPDYFDIVIATEPKLRNALLLRRVAHGCFISPALDFRLSDRRPQYDYPASAYAQMRCLASLAAGRELEPDTHILLPPAIEQLATALLPAGPCYVGLAPGSAGPRKRWPLECFIDLAHALLAREHQPVFFLGPEETAWMSQIQAAIPAALFPEQAAAAGDAGPLLTIALARRLKAAVANDAGGGHLLAAGGGPLVTLFGRTNADKFKPPYGQRIAISARDYGGTDMRLIPLEAVLTTLDRVIADAQP